jgi:hypothetical protein
MSKPATQTKTYRVATEADCRSKTHQRRTWIGQANSIEDAEHEARMAHLARVGWNASIWITSTSEEA